MKFSVLVPTRCGGHLLNNCISSVLNEPYADMELVVSDNANIDQTQAVIESFRKDPRLKVVRLEEPVSVTENWNYALSASCGDYILMIGDDDCLLPGFFNRVERILGKYNNPDCVTYNAYTYVARGSVSDDNRQSYYKDTFFEFGPEFKAEGLISAKMRLLIVKDMFRFRNRIPLNMQTTLMSKAAINQISGGIFKPPFPDHYALNSLLLTAKSWVYLPEKMLVVGISPKSFGHFIYSGRENEGKNYLGINSEFKGRLPGNELLNSMHVWLSLIKLNYKDYLKGTKISWPDYVRRQVYSWYFQYKFHTISLRELLVRFRKLSLKDWLALSLSITDKSSWQHLGLVFKSSKSNKLKIIWEGLQPLENIFNIKQFADWISSREILPENEKSGRL